MKQSELNKSGFVFLKPEKLNLKSKIENNGTPLQKWNIRLKKERNIIELENKLKDIEFDENKCQELNKNLQSLQTILSDSRIKASLAKFDETFWHKIKSENLRWMMFDFLILNQKSLYNLSINFKG